MPTSRTLVKKPLPTQARALETRARLLDAGRRAFAELGHDGVNLERDVLDVAGVKFGSFYHQFNDKTELLLAVMEAAAIERNELVMDKGFLDPAATTLADRLRLGVERLFESFDSDDHGWRVALQVRESTNPRIREFVAAGRERWLDRLSTMIAESPMRGDATPRLVAEVLASFAVGAAAMYLGLDADERATRRPEIVEAFTRFVLAGIEH